MAKTITKTCRCCGGTGREEVTGLYAETYWLLKKHAPCSGAELARVDGCKPTAMNNRLSVLEQHGLVTSHKSGRRRVFETK